MDPVAGVSEAELDPAHRGTARSGAALCLDGGQCALGQPAAGPDGRAAAGACGSARGNAVAGWGLEL